MKECQLKKISVAWPTFATKLITVLERLEEDQYLIISTKHSNQCVQFAAQGSFGMRVETTSNSYRAQSKQLTERQIASLIDAGWQAPTGTPAETTPENDPDGSPNYFIQFVAPVPFDGVADLAVRTFCEILKVPHPSFLQYEAIDDEDGKSEAIALPELGLKVGGRVRVVDTTAELTHSMLVALRIATDISDLDFEGDGSIKICCGSFVTCLHLTDDEMYVHISSALLRDVTDDPRILARLNDFNASETLTRFFFLNGVIFCAADISAVILQGIHVAQAFVDFCATADRIICLLQEEFGGRTFVYSMQSSMKH